LQKGGGGGEEFPEGGSPSKRVFVGCVIRPILRQGGGKPGKLQMEVKKRKKGHSNFGHSMKAQEDLLCSTRNGGSLGKGQQHVATSKAGNRQVVPRELPSGGEKKKFKNGSKKRKTEGGRLTKGEYRSSANRIDTFCQRTRSREKASESKKNN